MQGKKWEQQSHSSQRFGGSAGFRNERPLRRRDRAIPEKALAARLGVPR